MDEVICWGCIGDPHLAKEVKRIGEAVECSFCSKRRKCVSIEWLGDQVAKVLEEHIRQGEEIPVWGGSDSDRMSHYEQSGDPLNFWVADALQLNEDDAVVFAVCEELGPSHLDIVDGGEGRFDTDANYVRRRRRLIETEEKWQLFRQQIMHGRRFFNADLKPFLDWLFRGVEALRGDGLFETEVIRELQAGTSFFRARRCETSSALENMLKNPEKELVPPPKEKSCAGRMNPAGVPFFYGAYDRETCIAELRPPVEGVVVSGEFCLEKTIWVFDFVNLDSAYIESPSSYFEPGYNEKIERAHFLKTLHAKISKPVLPDAEHEYLITQVIAEYLATQFSVVVDGVIFRSAQRQKLKDAKNIALFSHVLPDIKLVPETLKVHKIKQVEYETETRDVYSGWVESYSEDYDSEWE
ncbi:RES family NAD+ phosphorylase [Pseudomonas aeruginosa]|uniref:RES family NAD+ phosphorylase n=1 Tax=Pseudomonas aeruginosa TaxID=287 RepID=UPI0010133E00|nr:RES domain-containing protein [Pseudomonas aeruginosa]